MSLLDSVLRWNTQKAVDSSGAAGLSVTEYSTRSQSGASSESAFGSYLFALYSAFHQRGATAVHRPTAEQLISSAEMLPWKLSKIRIRMNNSGA